MNIKEIANFKLSDAVKFHKTLNPKLWEDNHLIPEVREKLLVIAEDFLEELGIHPLKVEDVRIYGSNTSYTYTIHSDIDLHILVDYNDLPDNDVYKELFNAKKTIYNETHKVKIRGIPVELYVQDTNEENKSIGTYSILHDHWIKYPQKQDVTIDEASVKAKYEKLADYADHVLKTENPYKLDTFLKLLKRYRQAGLEKGGDLGPENLVFKLLRANNYIGKIRKLKQKLHGQQLSLEHINEASGYIPSEKEKNDPRFKTGLTVDVKPDSIQKNAKAFGSKVSRPGIPPQAKTNGKISENFEFKSFQIHNEDNTDSDMENFLKLLQNNNTPHKLLEDVMDAMDKKSTRINEQNDPSVTISQLEQFINSKKIDLIIGNKYIPVMLALFNGILTVCDIHKNSSLITPAEFGVLTEINEYDVNIEFSSGSYRYPLGIYKIATVTGTIFVETPENYEKLRTAIALKFDKVLPPLKI